MKDKTQYEALVEELQKTAENFRVEVVELGEKFSKLLPNIEFPEEEEGTWKMKCPYKVGDKHYYIQSSGKVFMDCWYDIESDNSYFSQGNTFPTVQAALLEVKRRNLLTRFRAFRDECNKGLSVQDEKWEIYYKDKKLKSLWLPNSINGFPTFGYFKNKEDAERAIELFGDEIKELYVDCEG